MISYHVNCSRKRGQLKIQQMAFVLVAFMILFGVAAVFYISIQSSSLEKSADELKHDKASEMVRKLASSPELSWTRDSCEVCVDLDKAFALKSKESYKDFWGKDVGLVRIQKVYPSSGNEDKECDASYEDCNRVTIYSLANSKYITEEAFVALCRYSPEGKKCELGKIMMGVVES